MERLLKLSESLKVENLSTLEMKNYNEISKLFVLVLCTCLGSSIMY